MKLEGEKFGRLIVIEKDINKGDANHPYWICQCECGNKKSIRQDSLRNKSTQSCGCLAQELSSRRIYEQGLPGANFQSLIGKKFGKLTVLNIERKEKDGRRYNILYRCKCDCGKETVVDANNLRSLHTTSCGCKKNSYGAFMTEQILQSLNIVYEKEKIFDDCVSDKNYYLRMDFYLPQYNTVIEVDGKQHSYTEPNGFFTQEIIDRIKILDTIKNEYCKNKNISLIRIPYKEWQQLSTDYILKKIKSIEKIKSSDNI